MAVAHLLANTNLGKVLALLKSSTLAKGIQEFGTKIHWTQRDRKDYQSRLVRIKIPTLDDALIYVDWEILDVLFAMAEVSSTTLIARIIVWNLDFNQILYQTLLHNFYFPNKHGKAPGGTCCR